MRKILALTILLLTSCWVYADESLRWAGPYVGFDAGYTTAHDNSQSYLPSGDLNIWADKTKVSGGLVGISAGYNLALGERFTLGLEGLFKIYNANGHSFDSIQGVPHPDVPFTTDIDKKISLLAKLGYLLNDKTLAYIEGGWSDANLNRSYCQGTCETHKNWQDGFTLGLGGEYNFYGNLTAKVDYQFTRLTDKSNFITQWNDSYKHNVNQNELTFGMAYHF